MLSSKTVLLLLTVSVTIAVGEVFQYSEVKLKGACPKVRYISNLNLPRTLGWYYRAYSNLDNPLCYNNEGQTMYVAQHDATRISAVICCRSEAEPDIPICGVSVGSGFVTATSNPGEFTYEFGDNVYPIYILDTDYDNFTIAYGCKPGSAYNTRDEVIYVETRGYTLSDTLEARARAVFKRNDIQWSKVKPVKQGPYTPYTPLAKQCLF